MLATDGVFSGDDAGGADFHPATDLTTADIAAVQARIRRRGLRWLHRHGHLDDLAVHALDSADHAGGWSVSERMAWRRPGAMRWRVTPDASVVSDAKVTGDRVFVIESMDVAT